MLQIFVLLSVFLWKFTSARYAYDINTIETKKKKYPPFKCCMFTFHLLEKHLLAAMSCASSAYVERSSLTAYALSLKRRARPAQEQRMQIRKKTYTHANTYRSMVYVSLIVNFCRVDQFCGGLCFSICLKLAFIYISVTTFIRISYLNLCFFIAINLWKHSSRVIFGKELTAGNVLEISVPFPPCCCGSSFNDFGTRNSSLCL